MTKVVHCKKERYDIYIGRPSKWGNPFSYKQGTLAKFRVKNREESIQKYKEWIFTQPELLADLHELKDKVLGCWCKPLLCHGDILAELVELPKSDIEMLAETIPILAKHNLKYIIHNLTLKDLLYQLKEEYFCLNDRTV